MHELKGLEALEPHIDFCESWRNDQNNIMLKECRERIRVFLSSIMCLCDTLKPNIAIWQKEFSKTPLPTFSVNTFMLKPVLRSDVCLGASHYGNVASGVQHGYYCFSLNTIHRRFIQPLNTLHRIYFSAEALKLHLHEFNDETSGW